MRKIPSILLTIFLICCALGSYGQNNTATRNYRSGGQYQYGKYGRNQSNYSLWDRVRNDLKEEAKKTKQEIDNNKDTRDNKARSKTVDTNESKDKEKGNQSNQDYSVGASEIELVVNGEGPDKTTATQNALRSAIEQAYGVFVSSNTSIFDDEIVREEIATISSGNIKAYKELASMKLPNGNTSVTLSAIVTISNLVSYVQSHGGSAEFAGQTFLMNFKTRELNKNNEIKVMENACQELREISNVLFDYSLLVSEPKKSGSGFYLPICIVISPNENFQSWMNKFSATLSAISMSDSEYVQWKNNGLESYTYSFFGKLIRLRNKYSSNSILGDIVNLLNSWESGFILSINNGKRSWKAAGRNDLRGRFTLINNDGIDIECLYQLGTKGPIFNVDWDNKIEYDERGYSIDSNPQTTLYLTVAFPFPSADELGEVHNIEVRPNQNY